jgi:hypothetical protein
LKIGEDNKEGIKTAISFVALPPIAQAVGLLPQ